MCNFNVIVVLEFISRDIYPLFAIRFSSNFQNSVFYQHMRPKLGLKFPRPLSCDIAYTSLIKFLCIFSSLNHEVGIWFQL